MVKRLAPRSGPAVRDARKAEAAARKKPTTPAVAPKAGGWTPKTNPRSASLDRALADRRVTDGEWRALAPELRQTALGAGEHRHLLEAFVDQGVAFDPLAAQEAHRVLTEKGYDVPGRHAGAPAVNLKHITEGNVAEADLAFEALSAALGVGGATVRVAIVDGGFTAHPLLADNLASAKPGAPLSRRFGQFTAMEAEWGVRHGTHVAGIATRGTSQVQASLFAVPIEVPDDPHAAQKAAGPSPLPAALEAAAKGGASVVNVSIEAFVTPAEAQRFREVMEKYPDTLFVFGAGNDRYQLGSSSEGDQTIAEAFKLPNMAVVGASLPDGGRWAQSNTSADFVDLAARGHAVVSADHTGPGLIANSGTSMAAPNVSNLAAKCRLLHPALTPAKVKTLLAATSDAHWSWKGEVASGGTVNPERAMQGAAALALTARGLSLPKALEQLGVPADERARLTEALAKLG